MDQAETYSDQGTNKYDKETSLIWHELPSRNLQIWLKLTWNTLQKSPDLMNLTCNTLQKSLDLTDFAKNWQNKTSQILKFKYWQVFLQCVLHQKGGILQVISFKLLLNSTRNWVSPIFYPERSPNQYFSDFWIDQDGLYILLKVGRHP